MNDSDIDYSIPFITSNFDGVRIPLQCLVWIGVTNAFKTVLSYSSHLRNAIPSSTALVFIGMVIGAVLRYATWLPHEYYSIEPETFFVILLAPIIFDAGYFMPNRAFFASIITILIFAVGLTIWNTVAIGLALHLFSSLLHWTPLIALLPLLLFSSLLSASDPVAVIAVLDDIHVNDFLFVHVFGEALFNDAIAVVIFNLFLSLLTRDLAVDLSSSSLIFSLVGGFVFVAVVSVILGILAGLLTALLTRLSSHESSVAPSFVLIVPYSAYLIAHATSLSSIITISISGMVARRYVEANLSRKGAETVRQATKILSHTSESVVYLYLGLAAFGPSVDWTLLFSFRLPTVFIVLTLILTFVARFVALFPLCAGLNLVRASARSITFKDQLVLAWSALRGAIAYFLADALPQAADWKPLFVTATLSVVYFNVFVQGITIRPLIERLRVECKEQERMVETTVEVREEERERRPGRVYAWFERFNSRLLEPLLTRSLASKWPGKYGTQAVAEITVTEKAGSANISQIAEEAAMLIQQRLAEVEEREVVTIRIGEFPIGRDDPDGVLEKLS